MESFFLSSQTQGLQMSQLASAPVKLFVIPPVKWSTQARRPLTYNFDDNFVDYMANTMASAADPMTTTTGLAREAMNRGAVLPNHNAATVVRTDQLEHWTFFALIPDEGRFARRFGDTLGPNAPQLSLMNSHQTFLYGFFVDEPINPMSWSDTHKVFNPNARMIFTHKTMVELGASYGQLGGSAGVVDAITKADADVIQPGALCSLVPADELYLTTPEFLQKVCGVAQDGTIATAITGHYALQAMEQAPVVESVLQHPFHNLKRVLDGFAIVTDELAAEATSGSAYPGRAMTRDLSNGPVWSDSSFGSRLANAFSGGNPFMYATQIDEGTVIKLEQFVRLYQPEIERCDPAGRTYDVMDQTERSPRAVYTSVLATAMPQMLADTNMLAIGFNYDSHSGAFNWTHIEPAVVMAPALQEVKLKALKTLLTRTLFPILTNAYGDFTLGALVNLHHASTINLNFYCDGQIMMGSAFEIPTVLGGLNSSLVGDAAAAAQAGESMQSLLKGLCGSEQTEHAPVPAHLFDNGQGLTGVRNVGGPALPVGKLFGQSGQQQSSPFGNQPAPGSPFGQTAAPASPFGNTSSPFGKGPFG